MALSFIQVPQSLTLTGAIPVCIIESTLTVTFQLLHGATEVMSVDYEPDSSNRISIYDLDRECAAYLQPAAIQAVLYAQPALMSEFTFVISNGMDEDVQYTFTAVRAKGINFEGNCSKFFEQNFFTLLPAKKASYPLQKEYLSFLSAVGLNTLRFEYITQAGQTASKQITTFEHAERQVMTYPVNLNDCDIDVLGLISYAVVLENAERSIRFDFSLDFNYYERTNQFLFVNEFGVPETVYCTGVITDDIDYGNKQEVSTVAGLHRIGSKKQKISVNTGLQASVAQAFWFRGLFDANETYLVHPTKQLARISISEQTAAFDPQAAISRNFQFTYAFSNERENQNYTFVSTEETALSDDNNIGITDNKLKMPVAGL